MQPSPTTQVARALRGGALAIACISISNVSFANKVQRYSVEVARPLLLTTFEFTKEPTGESTLRVAGLGRVKNHVLKIGSFLSDENQRIHFFDLNGDGLREFYVCGDMLSAHFETCSFYRLGSQGKFVMVPVFEKSDFVRIKSGKPSKKVTWERLPGITAGRLSFSDIGLVSTGARDVDPMTSFMNCYKYAVGTLIEVARGLKIDSYTYLVSTYSYSVMRPAGPRGYRLKSEKVVSRDKIADSFCLSKI